MSVMIDFADPLNDLFIKQCRASKFIQDIWLVNMNDRFLFDVKECGEWFIESVPFIDKDGKTKYGSRDFFKTCCEWLPYQEDIQELCMSQDGCYQNFGLMVSDFMTYVHYVMDLREEGIYTLYSFELLWLNFFHETLLKQRWNYEFEEWEDMEVE